MLRAVIFANGNLNQPPTLLPGDLVIAADGGAKHCLRFGIAPHTVIGDLDSLSPAEVDKLRSLGAEIVQYPTHKDFTDLELALQYAQQHGAAQVLLVGALGQRWDQTLANLLLPVLLPDLEVRLQEDNQELFLVRPGTAAHLQGRPGTTVSLIPLIGDAHGVSTQGLAYPLRHETLRFGATRGVSNVMEAEQAQVSLRRGLLMCIVIREETL